VDIIKLTASSPPMFAGSSPTCLGTLFINILLRSCSSCSCSLSAFLFGMLLPLPLPLPLFFEFLLLNVPLFIAICLSLFCISPSRRSKTFTNSTRSYSGGLTNRQASFTIASLTISSSLVSLAIAGLQLTSMSHGLSLSSKMTSNPKTCVVVRVD